MANTTTGGGSDGDDIAPLPNYDPQKEAEAKLKIGGNRVPIINDGVTTHIRKEGPLDINRLTEVHWPATAFDKDWLRTFGLTEDSETVNVGMPAEIHYRADNTEDWRLTQRGYVKGVGSGERTANDMKMQIGSIGDFFSYIPVNKTFTAARVGDVLKYIRETLEEEQFLFDAIQLDVDGFDTSAAQDGEGDWEGLKQLLPAEKRFTEKRDTLADVVSWLRKTTDEPRFWFEPLEGHPTGMRFVVRPSSSYDVFKQSTFEDGNIDLLENNATWQIPPFNAITLKGQARNDVDLPGGFEVGVSSPLQPIVTVQFDPLVELMGGQQATVHESNKEELEHLESEAKTMLQDMLSTSSTGMMRALQEPSLEPYSKLTVDSTNVDDIQGNATALPFEVEMLKHKATALTSGGKTPLAHTDIRVSMWAGMDEMSVTRSEKAYTDS